MRIGQTEGVKSQHVVVVTFDDNGTMQSITQKDLKDAVNVTMEEQANAGAGRHAGLLPAADRRCRQLQSARHGTGYQRRR